MQEKYILPMLVLFAVSLYQIKPTYNEFLVNYLRKDKNGRMVRDFSFVAKSLNEMVHFIARMETYCDHHTNKMVEHSKYQESEECSS